MGPRRTLQASPHRRAASARSDGPTGADRGERGAAASGWRVVKVPADLLAALERKLNRDNHWNLSVHVGQLTLVTGGEAIGAALEAAPRLPTSS